ncbi:MAG TPA: Asp-tRNA(Asn)/Glu-tRNA(Gln) amidotransferase subunit GatB [Kofleriaceae bacterium]|nr:Asp-tRNA(Asn)/Glu-tRNA(Gln) amidotransferase subunit GatB [Kofleriaceae bacterium]
MKWEPVIGLEVHVQLATRSKAFSASAAAFGAPPNALTDPTVLGLPGALPTFNHEALMLALRLGLATGCEIRRRSRFARKHYFYPDLPKGYQISQYDEPLCAHGSLEVTVGDAVKTVRLTRIHLEEDAGKNTHQLGATSLVDLNRAGVPLCEVVSEPDLRSAVEAGEYMRALRRLVRYLGVSEGNMEQGQLRCDANVSLRPVGSTTLGTRTELKNINSFRFVERAIDHEIARQARILDGGGTIDQETRLWDAQQGISLPMRSKEEANDYRYFPDPDLPPLCVDEATIAAVREALPELPAQKRARYAGELGLSVDDALTLADDRALADYFDAAVTAYGKGPAGAKVIANWILSELLRELSRTDTDIAACPIAPASLAALVALIDDATISGKIAKDVFSEMFATGAGPDAIVEQKGLRQVTDAGAIEKVAAAVIAEHSAQAAAYRAGKQGLLGFFVGQVMKQTGGKANPKLTNEILKKLLS